MDVIDPGHKYRLTKLDKGTELSPQILTFVKREGEGYPGNEGHHSGTTTQEVVRALIDRTKYVDNQIHDVRNDQVLFHLRSVILELELRAAARHGRKLSMFDMMDVFDSIETAPVCYQCGHIGCEGGCHG